MGDQVLLGSGIVGHIVEAGPEFLLLEISPGAHMTVARQAVVRTLSEPVVTSYDDDVAVRPRLDVRRGPAYGDETDPGAPDTDPHRPSAS